MAVTKEQVIDYLSNMTVMDMADLVKELEEKWGVEAAPAVMAGAMPAAADDGGEEEEEQTEFDVVIKEVGKKKIKVIKAIRQMTSLGLKEAKNMASADSVVKSGIAKEDAEKAKKVLEEAGATVELK
ncbi:MAG: 50S ribosomal protein L7/L12 [Deltaproteobacteria bacterium]|jgi:large subunit ribosomal protein L7/L12|nr:50S ribosomal protein L7/L12 [Deltaproteobacteria bacterium]